MNDHFDPTVSEVIADARGIGWRTWCLAAVAAGASVALLLAAEPALVVAAFFVFLFAHPGFRTVVRVVLTAVVLVAALSWIAVQVAAKGGGL